MLNHLDLFSGIGGFALGLSRVGDIRTIAFCEIDLYCQKLLKEKWKEAVIYDDIVRLDSKALQDLQEKKGKIDIITAGFPCQDLSVAGKGAGLKGERSGLFYEVIRIIKEVKPRFILFENSPELIRRDEYRGQFITSFQEVGYGMWWQLLCARDFWIPT